MLEYGKFSLSPEYAVADNLPEVNRPCYVRGESVTATQFTVKMDSGIGSLRASR